MIKISYQSYGNSGFHLRLRLYQSGETRFVAVTKLLKGAIQKRHWNQNRQMFIPSCPFSDENNAILVQFRQKYEKAAIDWNGSIPGLIAQIDGIVTESKSGITVSDYINKVVGRLQEHKHKDGTVKGSYENYLKCNKRLSEYCSFRSIDYSELLITDLTPTLVNSVLEWVRKERKGVGLCYISKILHSVITKADKDELLKLEDYRKCDWYARPAGSSQKCCTLTLEQCRRFISLDLRKVSKSNLNELYRDFCLFMLYTGQSACDAISLKYSDIKVIGGVSHFVFRRRKIADKQAVPCSVPISNEMDRIMNRWRRLAKDGYVFPIRNKTKLKTQTTNNGDIKHFLCSLNLWLKKIGKVLGCDFPLHSYTFRHTAITNYISKGVPVLYVANMMGTSVDNCEKIYYNNQGDFASRNKVLAAMRI